MDREPAPVAAGGDGGVILANADASLALVPADASAEASAPPHVVVVRAPAVAAPATTEQVDESGARPSWLDGRGVLTPTKTPPLDVDAAVTARAAKFVSIASVVPPDIDYLRRATGCRGRVPYVVHGATPPSAPEIEAAIAQAADAPVLWHRSSPTPGWFKGTVADAMLPLRGPEWAPLYLQLECMQPQLVAVNGGRALGVFRAGRDVEVFATIMEDFRQCPHSDMTRTTVLLSIAPDGTISLKAKQRHSFGNSPAPCVGRDTSGSGRTDLVPDDAPSYFAMLARDEGVSVGSFERLAEELVAAGAPTELVARARLAADDEHRHAAAMAKACAALGGRVVPTSRSAYAPRGLLKLLEENAREGCVNETFAALMAAHQATSAESPSHRALFAEIAADERRHAELAWDIDAWGRGQLDAMSTARLDAARDAAWCALTHHLETRADAAWRRALGEPAPARAHALATNLRNALEKTNAKS